MDSYTHLLDTNIVSDLVRHPQGQAAQCLAQVDPTRYGRIRAILQRIGQPIGYNDFLIAAHALALGAILVTDNLREFSRVPSLRVINWLN